MRALCLIPAIFVVLNACAADAFAHVPFGSPLRLTMPTRMVKDKTLTLKAEILDQYGSFASIDWRQWSTLGTVSAWRVSEQSAVPTSITVFDTYPYGAGGGTPPEDSIRFYNGVGSISITIDDPGSLANGEQIEIIVTVEGRRASKLVTVLDNVPGTFKELSGTLSGADLTWGPEDGVIHLTGDVTVAAGNTLTINPGTLVMADKGTPATGVAIHVSGNVNAQGAASEPIFFFASEGPAAMAMVAGNKSAWRGIYHDGVNTSTYSYVFITGAGNGIVGSWHVYPPVLRFWGSHSAVISDCVFADSPGKMVAADKGGGSITISRCLFSRNGIGATFGAVTGASGTMSILIEDSWFTRIGRAGGNEDGDIIHLDSTNQQIVRRCVLTDGGDEIIDSIGWATVLLQNCIAYDARDKLISDYGQNTQLYNVLAFSLGGAFESGGGTASQTTIATRNPFATGYTVNVDDCIIWPYSFDTCSSKVNINYTDIGDPNDLGCGEGNFSEDPLFVDPANNDYNLEHGSSALNAGSSGQRIGWLGFPEAEPCTDASECDDGNPCTNDTCTVRVCEHNLIPGCAACVTNDDCDLGNPCLVGTCGLNGTCSFAPGNEGQPCNDGWLCTTDDACVCGVCVGIENCPPGQECYEETGICEGLSVVTLQDGLDEYDGTQDTFLHEASPDAVNGGRSDWEWDGEDGGGENIGLLRFDSIFGTDPGQVPPGSIITSATLTLVAFNPTTPPAGDIHEALDAWEQSTAAWNNYGGEPGVQTDELGNLIGTAPTVLGMNEVDVTASLQAWSHDPASNLGWVFVPNSTDGLQVRSSEYATASYRPKLVIRYSESCGDDSDCDDGLFCNGVEYCDGDNQCQFGADPCSGQMCNETDDVCWTCIDNSECDDGNPCTDDTCTSGVCESTNNAAACDDGIDCTDNDVCAGGVCAGTDACTGGYVCNPATGVCDPPAPPLPIVKGDSWRYFKGTQEPSPGDLTAWAEIWFDDSSWLEGPSGFGYGDTTDCEIILSDMSGYYRSVYLRKQFNINYPDAVTELTLTMDYDDAYVAYVNGAEVFRSKKPEDSDPRDPNLAVVDNLDGAPPLHNAEPLRSHECSTGSASNPGGWIDTVAIHDTFDLSTLLVPGVNVMTIQGHNIGLNSSDFVLVPSLEATIDTCASDAECDDGFFCNGAETCVDEYCHPGVNPCPGLPCDEGSDTCMDCDPHSLDFDGVGDQISIANTNSLNPAGGLTLEAWARLDVVGSRQAIISKAYTAQSEPYFQYHLEVRPSGEAYFALSIDGTRWAIDTSGFAFSPGHWHHFAATYDGTTMRFYKQGEEYPTPTSVSGSIDGYATDLLIGNHEYNFPLNGLIDEVRIWNYARTQQQIQDNMGLEIVAETGLIGRWGMNECAGETAYDSSGNDNHGPISGTTWGPQFGEMPNQPPNEPVLIAPSDGAIRVNIEPVLTVNVTDPEEDLLDVTFYGRQAVGGTFQEIDTVTGVSSGQDANMIWEEIGPDEDPLSPCTTYDWYVTVSDGRQTSGPVWGFTTGEPCQTAADCDDGDPCTNDTCPDEMCTHDPIPDCCLEDANCDDGLFCNGAETCVDNVCVEGIAPCDDPCEQCDESTDTCDWCIFDLDGDGFIGPGDFSFFAGCYGGNYGCDPPDYRSGVEPCCIANFDESDDSFVGPGDFSGFAGCFGLNCNECATCWGSRSSKGHEEN